MGLLCWPYWNLFLGPRWLIIIMGPQSKTSGNGGGVGDPFCKKKNRDKLDSNSQLLKVNLSPKTFLTFLYLLADMTMASYYFVTGLEHVVVRCLLSTL